MTSNAITTKSTPGDSDSSKVLAIENLSQPRRTHTFFHVVMILLTLVSEGRESKVNGIEPEDDDLEDDDEEEFDDTDDSLCVLFFFLWPDTRLIYGLSVCVANKFLDHPDPSLRKAILGLPTQVMPVSKRKPRKEIMEAINRL